MYLVLELLGQFLGSLLLETYLAKPDPLILDFMAFGRIGVQQNLAIPAMNGITKSRDVSVVKVLSCVGFVFCWWWWWEILGVFCLCFLPCSLMDLSSQVMFLKIKTTYPLQCCISYLKFCLNLFPMPDTLGPYQSPATFLLVSRRTSPSHLWIVFFQELASSFFFSILDLKKIKRFRKFLGPNLDYVGIYK